MDKYIDASQIEYVSEYQSKLLAHMRDGSEIELNGDADYTAPKVAWYNADGSLCE